MTRMIEDYIARFYNKEAERSQKLIANDYALAKEIVAWKEKVASAWDGIKVFDVESSDLTNSTTGSDFNARAIIDTNGLGKNIGLELVVYKKEDGEERFDFTKAFDVVKEDGNVLTYQLHMKMKDPGVFRYGYRIHPVNPNLPHRMDFAYTRWI